MRFNDRNTLQAFFRDVDREVLQRCDEVIMDHGRPIYRGDLYARSRQAGETDRFAALCALREFPGCKTDDSFWAGRKHCAEVYGETYFNEVRTALAAQGVTMSAGQEYMPELAAYKGDPAAVVGHNARGHIRKVCEERGMACEGPVTVKAREPERDPLEGKRLAPDLVQENFENFARENPVEASKMDQHDIVAHMTDKHGT